MLFDPKWSKTGNDTSVSFKGFRNWVDAQNPRGRYVYQYKHQCAVGRWLKAIDHQDLIRDAWLPPSQPVLDRLDCLAGVSPYTYGALAKRLALADTSEQPF